MVDDPIEFGAGPPVSGDLEVSWFPGSKPGRRIEGPLIQVHRHDPHTFILRQSKEVSFEAPFMYLFCGNERALLLDTGASEQPARFPLRATVDDILGDWLSRHPRGAYPLVVLHTHGHRDHVAGDWQFLDRPATTVVDRDLAAVQAYLGISRWPEEVVRLDLGGRVLEMVGIPGHHPASIAAYDPWTGFLLTGDTVYPGRLYVADFPAFLASLDRLVAFCEVRPVSHVMGCHVEMRRTPGRDYPIGCTYQPDEADLPMTVAQLTAVRDAARTVADRPGAHRFDDVIIFHGPCRGAVARQVVRLLWGKARDRLG
ncbi:MAG: MBL fold metallo-hydrolase [Nocardioidaceae bacterium]